MGFKTHNIWKMLSPFERPYDDISHVILGYLCGYFKSLISILIFYQIINYFYGDERYKLGPRVRSLVGYIAGFVIFTHRDYVKIFV